MGWKFWTSEKSEAETSLEALQRDKTTESMQITDSWDDEVYVTLTATPVDRAPGSPLSCVN